MATGRWSTWPSTGSRPVGDAGRGEPPPRGRRHPGPPRRSTGSTSRRSSPRPSARPGPSGRCGAGSTGATRDRQRRHVGPGRPHAVRRGVGRASGACSCPAAAPSGRGRRWWPACCRGPRPALGAVPTGLYEVGVAPLPRGRWARRRCATTARSSTAAPPPTTWRPTSAAALAGGPWSTRRRRRGAGHGAVGRRGGRGRGGPGGGRRGLARRDPGRSRRGAGALGAGERPLTWGRSPPSVPPA